MDIRSRVAADVEPCVRILAEVHERDRYPVYLPDDLTSFVAAGDALGAWVATDLHGTVVGHVALHHRSWDDVMEVASHALGCSGDELAVVARLVVAPSARRSGAGRALLTRATDAARQLERMAILDVAAHYAAAIALYETAGWQRIGEVSFPMPDGTSVSEIVFAASAR